MERRGGKTKLKSDQGPETEATRMELAPGQRRRRRIGAAKEPQLKKEGMDGSVRGVHFVCVWTNAGGGREWRRLEWVVDDEAKVREGGLCALSSSVAESKNGDG